MAAINIPEEFIYAPKKKEVSLLSGDLDELLKKSNQLIKSILLSKNKKVKLYINQAGVRIFFKEVYKFIIKSVSFRDYNSELINKLRSNKKLDDYYSRLSNIIKEVNLMNTILLGGRCFINDIKDAKRFNNDCMNEVDKHIKADEKEKILMMIYEYNNNISEALKQAKKINKEFNKLIDYLNSLVGKELNDLDASIISRIIEDRDDFFVAQFIKKRFEEYGNELRDDEESKQEMIDLLYELKIMYDRHDSFDKIKKRLMEKVADMKLTAQLDYFLKIIVSLKDKNKFIDKVVYHLAGGFSNKVKWETFVKQCLSHIPYYLKGDTENYYKASGFKKFNPNEPVWKQG